MQIPNDRSKLQDEIVEVILEPMGTKELLQFAREKMHDTFDNHSYEELLVVADDYGIEVDIPEEVEEIDY